VIKLSIHESVEAALQKAFPKPAAAAKRALAKYISVVESMLFDALQRGLTPEQRKLGLYAISLEHLANKGGQIGWSWHIWNAVWRGNGTRDGCWFYLLDVHSEDSSHAAGI